MRLWAAIPIFLIAVAAQADTRPDTECYRAQQKEMLRLAHTQFCSIVGKPPAQIANALNQAMAMDPSWLPSIEWWNKIAEEYKRAGCGNS